ncbi:DUF4269 domain-containing protein [Labilibaculum sp. A4]|uniref:DUF4269 domain-containing protein n=1 Tax=Labilibaculum euxinus TaxID=2686357 RepID=UPI000F627EFD|nr:DUF4269 domain-containing protein [Labilibaculum euxinus]MDQ1769694.1 DUF4269 domain-containing protein [Labilibaculum euxinus]MWN76251.1 DUF4269 domain-containing protein [Labilibaculum euxinus]
MNWQDISYLNSGSAIQKRAFKCLNKLQVFNLLAEYSPILTGTIPIGISIDSSDLDITCRFMDADKFERKMENLFRDQTDFKIQQKEKNGYWVVVASFTYQDFPFEIFGSLFPPTDQNSYRHMLIEHRILQLLGEDFKQKVIQLKKEGLKTEPAFAKLLKLKGDPYQQLLNMEGVTDSEILQHWNKS